jgi:16S rRNA processing protein RimM
MRYMNKIKIGKIVNAVGLKGEVKVYNYSDSCDSYENLPQMYVGDELKDIESFRLQKNMVILKLSGINNRDDAERAKGKELFITEADLPELPEGQYYVRDLLGMDVILDSGESLGKITDVIQNSAQDIFEVERQDGSKVLIPRVDQFVLNIDADKRVITVRLIEGMLDL